MKTGNAGNVRTSGVQTNLRSTDLLSSDPHAAAKGRAMRRRRGLYWLALVIVIAAMLVSGAGRGPGIAHAADGDLDPGFDGDGKVTTGFGPFAVSSANAIAIQSDGQIVAVGSAYLNAIYNFALARYNPDGSLDTSFDGDGQVITNYNGRDAAANAVAIQDDGKIVVAGYADVADQQRRPGFRRGSV